MDSELVLLRMSVNNIASHSQKRWRTPPTVAKAPLILDQVRPAETARLLPPITLCKHDGVAFRNVVRGIAIIGDVDEVGLAPDAHGIPIAIITKSDKVECWDNRARHALELVPCPLQSRQLWLSGNAHWNLRRPLGIGCRHA